MDFPYGGRLADELGPARRPRRLDSSPRSNVWTAELPGKRAVIKQIVGGRDAPDRYAREVTALRLAARAEPPVAPRLLATDPATRVLVLEHLDDDAGSPELRAERVGRDDWLLAYARALARLHTITAQRPHERQTRKDKVTPRPPRGADPTSIVQPAPKIGEGERCSGDNSPLPHGDGVLPAWDGPGERDVRAFLGLADALGVSGEPDAAGELTGLVARLGRAAGRALLHGDPCPGNDFLTPTGMRFVDFEQAALGNGLVELAYLRIGFPTCWCVTDVPEPLLVRAEEAYRSVWRDATGEDPDGDLTDACAGWLIRGDGLVPRADRGTVDHLARILAEDWSWGTVTARQRLAYRLGVVARLAADRDDLAALGRLAAAMRGRMLDRWPGLRPPPAPH